MIKIVKIWINTIFYFYKTYIFINSKLYNLKFIQTNSLYDIFKKIQFKKYFFIYKNIILTEFFSNFIIDLNKIIKKHKMVIFE